MHEDRLTGKGRVLRIKFVVLTAYGQRRSSDPIVYFDGGPGAAAIADIPIVRSQLLALNRDRDLVLIDQRGTGGSNPLTCPSPPATLADASQVRRSIDSCLASLRDKADLGFYTSAMAAEDAAQVLTALHYGKVDLFGGSYGATAAQVFQQMFPGRVRTMTLLGGTLLSIPLFERFAGASQRALDEVLSRCASDLACGTDFPHLATEWTRLRASLAARPVTVPAALSPTGSAVRVDNLVLAAGIHQLLLSANTAVYVPLLIHSLAAAKGRPAAVAAVIHAMSAAGMLTGSGNWQVISYPIRCAEPWARFQSAKISDIGSYYYQSSLQDARWWQFACTLAPAAGGAARYGQQHRSAVPVLMINGTADPQDPPANMSGAQSIWPNSRLIVEPGQSHGIDLTAWMQCDEDLVQAFVAHASVAGLDTRCLANVTLPVFPSQW